MVDELAPTGAQVLARRIKDLGVDSVFALSGASHTHLLFALEDLGVAIVGVRHETTAVAAADGYARASGKIGVALLISEQGLHNAITGIATAFQAGSPVVIIATRYPDVWVEANTDFVADHQDLVASIIKWRRTAPNPHRLTEYFDAACKAAVGGRPGPALLSIPQNFLAEPSRWDPAYCTVDIPAPPVDPDGLARTAALIAAAQRPIIIADSGAASPGAEVAFQRLASQLGIPVLGNGLGRGLAVEDEVAGFPWVYGQALAREADLIVTFGARLDMWFGFGRPPRFSAEATLVQIASRPEDIGRNQPVDLALVGDPARAAGDLGDRLQAAGYRGESGWAAQTLGDRRRRVAEVSARSEGMIHPLEVGALIQALKPADAIVVVDGADVGNWMHASLRLAAPRSYMDHMPMGSMGVCLPLAIGAAAAERETAGEAGRPARKTVLVTGDGSLGFYVAELDTLRRETLNLAVFVSNDMAWGTEFHGQELAVGRSVNTRLADCDFARVAEGFGCAGWRVTARADLAPAVAAALSSGGPMLVDVVVDPMSGRMRKTEPLLGMVIFEDLPRQPASGR